MEMLLHQKTLMFTLQVTSPLHWKLEICTRLFQDAYCLGVGESLKFMAQHEMQTRQQLLIKHVIEELQIISAMLKRVIGKILEHLFRQIHVIVDIVKGHFWLDHPKFSKVTRCITILRTECRAKRINLSQRGRT